MRKVILAVSLLFAGAAADAQSVGLVRSTEENVEVRVTWLADRVRLESVGPSDVAVNFEFDTNNNGRIDPRVDRAYGFTSDDEFCPSFQLSEEAHTGCGTAPAAAFGTLRYKELSGQTYESRYRLVFPLSEITNDPGHISVTVNLFNKKTGHRETWKGVSRRPGDALGWLDVRERPCPWSAKDALAFVADYKALKDEPIKEKIHAVTIVPRWENRFVEYEVGEQTILGARAMQMAMIVTYLREPITLVRSLPGTQPGRYDAAFRRAVGESKVTCTNEGCEWVANRQSSADGDLLGMKTWISKDDKETHLYCYYAHK